MTSIPSEQDGHSFINYFIVGYYKFFLNNLNHGSVLQLPIYYFSQYFFAELDDGAYNPLWSTRGFTQTFHFWKENRRAQSVPFNAYLTYVTLPWFTIITGDFFSTITLAFSNEGDFCSWWNKGNFKDNLCS